MAGCEGGRLGSVGARLGNGVIWPVDEPRIGGGGRMGCGAGVAEVLPGGGISCQRAPS